MESVESEAMMMFPVILSGGSGTRLWPLSRSERPKQFLPIVTDRSMMQETILRTAILPNIRGPLIVASEAHGDMVAQQMAEIGVEPSAIMLEPEGRNTAIAIAIAAHWIVKAQGDGLMLVMPSDHVIADLPSFHVAIEQATPAALSGCLVTFGIRPSHAETGYGYIERGEILSDLAGVHKVAQFVEKPARDVAERYVAGGDHYWNGGIFLFTAQSYLRELALHAPEIAAASAEAMADAAHDGAAVRPEPARFRSSPNMSIDYAVMEKTGRAAVIPVDMGWSDVGSWDALWAVRERDANNNCLKDAALTIDSTGNLIYVDGGPPVAALGMHDCVIVSTAEGVLVMPRERSQDVKAIVEMLKGVSFRRPLAQAAE
ncbi:mannose-1-phosphate guanylyltransferase/mannose-6-phosphate isomerase [Sphingobium sp. AN641]|uniref:mannose-1-phosphate guanylyltransferase/mannose-6-phosphate isomerase n=1 Tax=Sphingobium sp. AN641 TaxID=3133443 RepID=UPI0030BF7A1A